MIDNLAIKFILCFKFQRDTGVSMYSFIVLGIIPGTNIVISFETWLVTLVVALFIAVRYRRYVQAWGRAADLLPVRVPLHASQLHQRVQ